MGGACGAWAITCARFTRSSEPDEPCAAHSSSADSSSEPAPAASRSQLDVDAPARMFEPMVGKPTADQVGALSLFCALRREEHERLADLAILEAFPAGTTIFDEGDPPGDLYVVLEGRVTLCMRVPAQPETCFLSLRAGELLGWSALLRRRRVATARTVQPARLLRLPSSDLLELCEADHDVGYVFMRRAFEELADRLQSTRLQLLDMFGKPGP